MNDLFKKHFNEKGFAEPTLIQQKVAEPLRNGESVLGLSPTGSGKTLAFALPLMEKITHHKNLPFRRRMFSANGQL